MHRLYASAVALLALSGLAAACTQRGAGMPAPSALTSAACGLPSSIAAQSANGEQPPFNLEVVLRGEGFGLVKFRQDRDETRNIVTLDTFVRDLLPNTSYSLQRAVDTVLDGTCTNASGWLTLGEGTTPHPIVTDGTGIGRASLWRNLSAFTPGATFDINFRVIENHNGHVALQSECYRFVVRD